MPHKPVIKDIRTEQAVFSARLVVLGIVVVLLTLLLAGRVAKLQVLDYEHYSMRATNNRVRLSPIVPARGLIYDRNGTVVAENQTTYNLEVSLEDVDDIGKTLQQLKSVIDLTEDEITRFYKTKRRTPRYHRVPLRFNLDDEDVARFLVARPSFPGVDVQASLKRFYPFSDDLVHVLGYVGRINDRDQETYQDANYRGTTHVGKSGIERFYEQSLHGVSGVRQEEINSHGQVIRLLEEQRAQAGDNLMLSLDLNLQKIAREALSEDYAGAVVALDPRNGEVLAAVSQPGFDPNLFVNGISEKAYRVLTNNADRPLFNRITQGQYPPGSTIKPITALTGLQHGIITAETTLFAGPYYQIPNDDRRYRDWNRAGHGLVDVDKAIAQSSDVFFYDLSYKTGIDRMSPMFNAFGLGVKTEVDLPGEKSGLMPSRQWKRKKYKQPWFPGETIIAGIGQGYVLATPLQLSASTGCLAMQGDCYKPHLLRTRLTPGVAADSIEPALNNVVELDDQGHWKTVKDAMEHVVHASNGSARRVFKDAPYTAAGKTGTAQVFSLQGREYNEDEIEFRLRDHGLFVGYAPADDPVIAVAVVVEHGGSGSRSAAPVARKIFDYWLEPNGRLSGN